MGNIKWIGMQMTEILKRSMMKRTQSIFGLRYLLSLDKLTRITNTNHSNNHACSANGENNTDYNRGIVNNSHYHTVDG